MENLGELFKIIIPAATVLYGMYLLAKTFLDKQIEQKRIEILAQNQQNTLPLRLQAYERMILFLERTKASNLLLRIQGKAQNVEELQLALVNEVRNEFQHNLAQQLYIGPEVWQFIEDACQYTLATINSAASDLKPKDPAIELSRKILEMTVANTQEPIQKALQMLKAEAFELFEIPRNPDSTRE